MEEERLTTFLRIAHAKNIQRRGENRGTGHFFMARRWTELSALGVLRRPYPNNILVIFSE